MSRKSDLGTIVQGLIYWALIARVVASALKINWLPALGLSLAASLLLVLSAFAATRLFTFCKRVVTGLQRCPHGIRRSSRKACQACARVAAEKQATEDRDRAERERLQHLRKSAETLRQSEIKRLSEAWQSASHSYFSMDDHTFEDAIAELFRRLGYKVEQTPYTNDGGKDAIAWRDGKKYVIECKRYGPNTATGRRDIQILLAAMHDEKADGAFFVSTGKFTSTAVEYGRTNGVELYDRVSLPALVNQAYGPPNEFSSARIMCLQCGAIIEIELTAKGYSQAKCPRSHIVTSNITLSDLGLVTSRDVPTCPKCGATMRIVRGRRGEFWGCSRYPKCRSTRATRRNGTQRRSNHNLEIPEVTAPKAPQKLPPLLPPTGGPRL